MSNLEAWRKAGVFLRVGRDYAMRNRTVNALVKAASSTVRSFGNVAHQLWLEVTGTVFLAMAAFGAFALVREYGKYHSGHETLGRLAIAACFTVAFGWFAFSSFWRVRRKG